MYPSYAFNFLQCSCT